MNFTDFITYHGKKVNKGYYINLIQVSKSDGIINPEELDLLHREGKRFGLTDPEIDKLISEENLSNYHAPYSLDEKFEHLYNVAEIVLADEVVTESERKLLKKFAIESGLADKAIDELIEILLQGIKTNESEESVYVKFRRALFS